MPRLFLDPSSAPQSRDSSPSKTAHLASQASESLSHSNSRPPISSSHDSHTPAHHPDGRPDHLEDSSLRSEDTGRKRDLLSGYDTHACDTTDGACEHGLLSPRESSPTKDREPAPGVYERRGGKVVRVGVVDEERGDAGAGLDDVVENGDAGMRLGKASWGRVMKRRYVWWFWRGLQVSRILG